MFKAIVFACVVIAALSFAAPSVDTVAQRTVPEHIRDSSVLVLANNKVVGTGVIVTRDGVNYVWTAAHVVEDVRNVINSVDPVTGQNRKHAEFGEVDVVQSVQGEGRTIGRVIYTASVVRYSNPDSGLDLCLLRVLKRNAFSDSTEFDLDERPPLIGTPIYHFGCFRGYAGEFSLSDGLLSNSGRWILGHLMDQISCPHWHGSSGGGCYLKDGRCIGLLDITIEQTWGYITPVRKMKEWAKKVGVEFALDSAKPVPSDNVLARYPTDDVEADNPYYSMPTTRPSK